MSESRPEAVKWYLLAAGLLAAGWFAAESAPLDLGFLGDALYYQTRASLFVHGSLPYRDVPFEYPPLAAVLFTIPDAGGQSSYQLLWALLTAGLGLALLFLTGRLAAITGGNQFVAAFAIALLPFLLGAIVRQYFDLAPTLLVVAALLALVSGRTSIGFLLIGLGAMTKGFPILVAPVALAWLLGRGEKRQALVGAVVLAVTVAIIVAPAIALSPDGSWATLRRQIDRPIQVESSQASVLHVIDGLGGDPVRREGFYGSQNLRHPAESGVKAGFGVAMLSLIALFSWAAARAGAAAQASQRTLVLASLGAVLAFAALGKVLSPQYLVWAAPLLALAAAWRMWSLAAAAALAIVLTGLEVPGIYVDLLSDKPFALVFVGVRNLALLLAILLILRAVWPPASEAQEHSASAAPSLARS